MVAPIAGSPLSSALADVPSVQFCVAGLDARKPGMRNLFDKLMSFGLKSILVVYLLIALLVGIGKHRESGTPSSGTVTTILAGAAWPITLLIDSVQRK
jgi:hypothetical protein